MLGDAVNLASRLEAANKTFGTRILLSAATRLMATVTSEIRAVGEVDLRGVPIPISVFTLD